MDGKNAYEAILENFYEQLAPISGRKPYMVSPGNHEADCTEVLYHQGACPDGQSNFTDFYVRFENNMPTAFPSSSSDHNAISKANMAKALSKPPFWYSFDYGQVHVTMINTETDFDKAPDGPDGSANLDGGPFGSPGQQLNFLEADLASVDRSVTPWVIVAGHRPWYSTGGSDNICTPCQDAFEKTLYKHGVDIAIFGHVHNAQAFKPVFNNTADPAGFNNPKAPYYSKCLSYHARRILAEWSSSPPSRRWWRRQYRRPLERRQSAKLHGLRLRGRLQLRHVVLRQQDQRRRCLHPVQHGSEALQADALQSSQHQVRLSVIFVVNYDNIRTMREHSFLYTFRSCSFRVL